MDLPAAELMKELAAFPIEIPGQDNPIRYENSPGMDRVKLLQLATTLSRLDPGVLAYHAEGQAQEYLVGFDLDRCLTQINCPLLLLQGNPSLGGMMTDQVIAHVLSKLPAAMHVLINEAGHDLGLETWEIAPLMRAVTSFLDSLS